METPLREELVDLLREVNDIKKNIKINATLAGFTSGALGVILGLGIAENNFAQSFLSGVGIPVTGAVGLLMNNKITEDPLEIVEEKFSKLTGLSRDMILSYEILLRAEEVATKEFLRKTVKGKEYDIRYLPTHQCNNPTSKNMSVEEYITYCKVINRMNLTSYTNAYFYTKNRIEGLMDLIELRIASKETNNDFVSTVTKIVDGWQKHNSFNDYIIQKYNLNKDPKIEQYRIRQLAKGLKSTTPTPTRVDRDLVERNTLYVDDVVLEK